MDNFRSAQGGEGEKVLNFLCFEQCLIGDLGDALAEGLDER